jgi:hypothetical protein
MATCLALASGYTPAAPPRCSSTDNHKHNDAAENGEQQQHDDREDAAAEAALAVAMAVDEDSLGSLVSELLGALEDVSGRALGACRLITDFAKATRHDIEDHADDLLTVRGVRGLWEGVFALRYYWGLGRVWAVQSIGGGGGASVTA